MWQKESKGTEGVALVGHEEQKAANCWPPLLCCELCSLFYFAFILLNQYWICWSKRKTLKTGWARETLKNKTGYVTHIAQQFFTEQTTGAEKMFAWLIATSLDACRSVSDVSSAFRLRSVPAFSDHREFETTVPFPQFPW